MTTASYLVTLLTIIFAHSDVKGSGDNGPPYIVSFPSSDFDGENAFSKPLKIECKGTGKEPITYIWKKFRITDRNSEETLPSHLSTNSDGTLISIFFHQIDDGYYQCFASNDLGTTFTRKVKVKVKSVSDFDEPKTPTIIGEQTPGKILSINCPRLTNGPGYGVLRSWGYVDSTSNTYIQLPVHPQNGSSYEHRITKLNGDLVLSPLKEEDCKFFEKNVKCKAEAGNTVYYSGPVSLSCNAGSSASAPSVAPKWVENLPSNQVAIQGKEHTMACAASGVSVPDITWFKGDLKIENGVNGYKLESNVYYRILSIKNVDKLQHEGRYNCVASNRQDTIESYSILKVLVQPTLVKPMREKEPIKLLTNKTLECKASGIPTPRYSWWRNGKNISVLRTESPDIRPRMIPNGNTLEFYKVELEDSGVYQCVAENDAGMAVTGSHVLVQAQAPTFDGFGPFPIFLNGIGKLQCKNDAAPPANDFKWYKDNTLLTISGRYSMDDEGTLLIKSVQNSDDGNYKCEAKNFMGSKMSKAAPTTLYDQTVISTKPQNTIVIEGTTMELRCAAKWDERLEIKYKWIKDGTQLTGIDQPSNRIYWDEIKNMLQIRNVISDDAGKYTCIAYTPGPYSEAQATAIADVAGAPDPPSNLQITDCNDLRTRLSWTKGASRDSPITHFLVEQESNHEPGVYKLLKNVTEANVNSTELELPAWATLKFRVRAVNFFGRSRGSEPTTTLCKTKETSRRITEKSPPFYTQIWFIVVVAALLLIFLIIIILALVFRNRGAKYPVGKREKARAGMLGDYPDEEESSINDEPLQNEKPPPYGTFSSPEKHSVETDSDKDSM